MTGDSIRGALPPYEQVPQSWLLRRATSSLAHPLSIGVRAMYAPGSSVRLREPAGRHAHLRSGAARGQKPAATAVRRRVSSAAALDHCPTSGTRTGGRCARPRASGPPTDGVSGVERAPERHVRWRGHAGRLHDRADVRLGFVEEGVEAVRIGPLVDGHVLATRAVPAMRDEPVTLGHVHDAADRVGLRRNLLLEGGWIAAHAQGDDDWHGSSLSLASATLVRRRT